MERYERVFKALSQEKRLKVFTLLLKIGEECYVCEIADALLESHYNISKYLNDLKREGLVKEKKLGKGTLYSVKPSDDEFLRCIHDAILSIPDSCIERELHLLKLRLSLREKGKCTVRVKDPRWLEIIKEMGIGSEDSNV